MTSTAQAGEQRRAPRHWTKNARSVASIAFGLLQEGPVGARPAVDQLGNILPRPDSSGALALAVVAHWLRKVGAGFRVRANRAIGPRRLPAVVEEDNAC